MPEREPTAVRNSLLLALAFTAGFIDALSYLGLGQVFTANMTGNTVLLGIALATLDGDAIARAGLALAGFVMGAVAGAWVVERDDSSREWPLAVTLALMLESALLVAFAAIWRLAENPLMSSTTTVTLILLSSLAMGVQSAAVRRLEVLGIATTYLTGTVTNLASLVMGRSRRKRKPPGHSGLLAGVWILYVGGAGVAAISLPRNLMLSLALPVTLILVVVASATIVYGTRPARRHK